MSDAARVQISVELDRGDGPISGIVHAGDDDSTEFAGWLELISLLERLRAEPPTTGKESS
jgi:hypothetical protein